MSRSSGWVWFPFLMSLDTTILVVPRKRGTAFCMVLRWRGFQGRVYSLEPRLRKRGAAMKQEMQGESSPERVVWYRDLVEEMTRCAPQVGQTTVPVLMDGRFWQMVRVVASVPAFVSSAGFAYGAMRGYGD